MANNQETKEHYTYEELVQIIATLRGENGCPWDREQTHETVKFAAVEEAYELMEAINNKDDKNMAEELGDLLLQVLFHGQIASEIGSFSMADVIDGIAQKLVFRHPHVFGSVEVENSGEVSVNWDELKIQEKNIQSVSEDLKQVPKSLPALIRSKKIQKKAAKVGYEFKDVKQVLNKVVEELDELKDAIDQRDEQGISEEFGDLLFTMVNLSRFLDLNPEISLTNSLEKFINRFEGAEKRAKASNSELSEMTPSELDELWLTIKETNSRESDC